MRAWIARQMVTMTGLFALAFCGVLAGTWGCGDGGGDGGPCGDIPSACSELKDGDSCDKCMGSCCCTQLDACASSSACTNLVGCAAACSSDSCIEDCLTSYSSGATIMMNLFECMDGKCSSSSTCG